MSEHKSPEHKVTWVLNKDESVFGLKRVNAVLECKICSIRRKPEIFPLTDFNITGKTILTYTLKEAACPTTLH